MRKRFLFLLCFFFISNILALCNEGQIDVNTASLEELDKLSGIGLKKGQAIIDARPFQSIDNLIDVTGIGEITLANIKQQNLACVSGEEKTNEEEDEDTIDESNQEEIEDEENDEEERTKDTPVKEEITKTKSISPEISKIPEEEVKTIVLSPVTPKSIKTENNKEQSYKNKFAIYGLVLLCIILAFLFKLKKGKNEKSEFR